jgi:hypothetical protein
MNPESVKLTSENSRDNCWINNTKKMCGARIRTKIVEKGRAIPLQERNIPGETYPKTRILVVFHPPLAAEENVEIDL